VIYPTFVLPIDAGRQLSIRAIDASLARDRAILILAQKDKEIDEPTSGDLYPVGTACQILRMKKNPDGSVQMLVQAVQRARVAGFTRTRDFLEASIELLAPPADEPHLEIEALSRQVRAKFEEAQRSGKYIQPEIAQYITSIDDPGQFADFLAFHFDLKVPQKQEILETVRVTERLRKVLVFLDQELELLKMQQRIQTQVKEEIDKNQREYFLREQLKAIQKELGQVTSDGPDEVEEFREKLDALELSEVVLDEAERELGRLERMHPDSAEASVIRTYLGWITDLPWNSLSEDHHDIAAAAKVLEEDHYGLDKVKDRVLEFLAVRYLRRLRAEKGDLPREEANKGPILCFAGPPGVGKTSIARSIARALGRKYVRISLGGARDESDIRGHRRTYIGAMPGRIMQGLKQARTRNPVFLLDEVDKLGHSFQGDPSAALLEVLDPAQNDTFVDHYLGVPFDLSAVMFLTTANFVSQVPAPLLDRLEIIEFGSYVEPEKIEIARRYLVPRQVKENGLRDSQIHVSDKAIQKVIASYTREAGVRNLERELGSVLRKAARKIAEGEAKRLRVTEAVIEKYLGPAKILPEVEAREDLVGVATGMYYTPVGGDIMFVEATSMKGKAGLVLTGHLGEVMKESARAALTYAKSNAASLGIPPERLEESEVHIHVPAGAVPKDGPSAGVTMATALISSLTGKPVRRDVAMTGEITLQGRVLPIGGIKEKILGARRAGIKTVILPRQNGSDLDEIPLHLRRAMEFKLIDRLEEALQLALREPTTGRRKSGERVRPPGSRRRPDRRREAPANP
jgi:ATP-dependent Lon protease